MMAPAVSIDATTRLVSFGANCAPIPERLLLAHARGQVLFVTGAGTSQAANLPDFRGLVLRTYEHLDTAIWTVLSSVSDEANEPDCTRLRPDQVAEVRRFMRADYDVVLGMLERRMDGVGSATSRVRQTVARVLREGGNTPAPIHRSLMRLADRGGAVTIVTTNFDLLLEAAARSIRTPVQSYALGAIPRPSHRLDFAGVFHIHGALDPNPERMSDVVVTDQDFGEFYLRRRAVPDFIYDAARLFHIVLVGYSANDPPMRYLLNAVAADGSRFDDLKERFTFISREAEPDPAVVEDWKGRGITPIVYAGNDAHAELARSLERWATFSAVNGTQARVDAELRRLVRTGRSASPEADRDLFDHLIRRADAHQQVRMSKLVSTVGADLGWLDAIVAIAGERS